MLDPVRLAGLKQATYIMQCLTTGQSGQQIAMALGGDEQLVSMWVSFLRHNHWIMKKREGWSVTSKGEEWTKKILHKESE
jgi:predicted transcriptional regulator